VRSAENWRWSSLWHRVHGSNRLYLDEWPVPAPKEWLSHVNRPQTEAEVEAIHNSVRRGAPFGKADWQQQTAKQLGLGTTLQGASLVLKKTPDPFRTLSADAA
jgi:putative transposase